MSHEEKFFNRELSWLEFNHRVLMQAIANDNPIFEQMKFLSIVSSNLDEFFMIRAASIKDQISANYTKKDFSGFTARETLKAISKRVHTMTDMQSAVYNQNILPKLAENSIFIIKYKDTSSEQKKFIKKLYKNCIHPVLTPLLVDKSHPFPLILNKSLNLGVLLKSKKGNKEFFATVQIPSSFSRLIKLPSDKNSLVFITIEDIIKEHIESLFSGYLVKCSHEYRITRNGDLSYDEEEATDLLSEIKKSLNQRKWGQVIRLEIKSGCDEKLIEFLSRKLQLKSKDIYTICAPLNLTFLLKELYPLQGFDKLRYKKFTPKIPPEFLMNTSIFNTIKEKDTILLHPYDSFDPLVRLLNEAASDPDVLAIKQTLYRVSGNSPIVEALARAVDNGKQVTALIEVKARFDEENNIEFGEKLAKSGANIIYGMAGLKTHSKITLIVRREGDSIRRYMHLGTGNYNDVTAKTYTDYSLLTANEEFGEDATSFFNLITSHCETTKFKHFITAPDFLRTSLMNLIAQEKKTAENGGRAEIFAKMNSLVDKKVIKELYKAAAAGVKVRLIVRGICCLRPDIANVSENIEVRSIVGRFLEHSRIYYFYNGGNHKLYLSSADLMPRNLDRRIELMFPILDENILNKVLEDIELMWSDNVNARKLDYNGQYLALTGENEPLINSQEKMINDAT